MKTNNMFFLVFFLWLFVCWATFKNQSVRIEIECFFSMIFWYRNAADLYLNLTAIFSVVSLCGFHDSIWKKSMVVFLSAFLLMNVFVQQFILLFYENGIGENKIIIVIVCLVFVGAVLFNLCKVLGRKVFLIFVTTFGGAICSAVPIVFHLLDSIKAASAV